MIYGCIGNWRWYEIFSTCNQRKRCSRNNCKTRGQLEFGGMCQKYYSQENKRSRCKWPKTNEDAINRRFKWGTYSKCHKVGSCDDPNNRKEKHQHSSRICGGFFRL